MYNSLEEKPNPCRKIAIGLGVLTFALTVSLIALIVVLSGKSNNNSNNGSTVSPAEALRQNTTAFMTAAMDLKTDPCDDFYQYACGTWLAKTTIPADKSQTYYVIDAIDNDNRAVLKDVLESSLDWPLISGFYRECMNQDVIDAMGLRPLNQTLAEIDQVQSNDPDFPTKIMAIVAKLHLLGAAPFFQFVNGADLENPTLSIGQLNQGGLALPDPSSYLDNDPDTQDMRQQYLAHIRNMFTLANLPIEHSVAEGILAIETNLAKASLGATEARDINGTYNPMPYLGLVQVAPGIPWATYFSGLGLDPATNFPINVQTIKFVKAFEDGLARAWLVPDMKNYLRWQYIHAFASYLPKAFVNEDFNFFGQVISGAQALPERWRVCTDSVDSLLGQMLGRYYVQAKFSTRGKKLATDMMLAVIASMKDKLTKVPWMDDVTRARAQTKLNQFQEQIGYPDRWDTYSGLFLPNTGYFADVASINQYLMSRRIKNIGGQVDRQAWEMTPPTVNAYYEPSQNQIVLPAGILQGLYFNENFHPAINFGGTGGTQGHEMTHGFDDQGAQFDGLGKFTNWWSPVTLANWHTKTKCLDDFFSKYEVLPGLHLNGSLTLGENIADCGGIKQAFNAYKTYMTTASVPGLDLSQNYLAGTTNDQLFFLSYAQGWCVKTTDAATRVRQKTNPHAPGKFRVNGPLSQFPGFADAYNCKAGSKMRLDPAALCDVW